MFKTVPEVKAALASMHPVAASAADAFAALLLENPHHVDDEAKVKEFCQKATYSAYAQAYPPQDNPDYFERLFNFIDNHGVSIFRVGIGIAVFIDEQKRKQQSGGWLGTAAAVGIGAILGAIFS